MQEKWSELRKRLAQVYHLQHASAVLGWDQETYMPPRGAGARAEQLAVVNKITHESFTAPEIGRLLAALHDHVAKLPYDSDDAALVRVTQRDYDKLRRVPPELIEEISRESSLALEAWKRARPGSDFRIFQPHLERMVELKIQQANYLGYPERIYDALLDQYEPGITTHQVVAIFQDLKKDLVPLVKAISAKLDRVDDACLYGEYDEQKQWEFGVQVIKQFGYDFEGGRQDRTAHPFTTRLGWGDVRITTRVDKYFFNTAFFSTTHECGHALYDMNLPETLGGTPLADGASLGVHESQSRLWENLVGRSRDFWGYYYPRLQAVFPAILRDVTAAEFYRAVNRVKPSFIRVEADEVTYNLHIMLRFELENDLLERKVKVAEVPEAWNAKAQAYLGATPPNDAQGCLQDIHWAFGDFGYFPTYSLGNLLSVQFFEQAKRAVPAIPAQIARGEFAGLRDWLRENIHRHGRKFTLDELARRVTGEPLNAKPYVAYLRSKYGEIYGV